MRQPAIYGLDIETDTSVDGTDPAVAPIITVALSNTAFDEVFTGPEDRLLADLDERLRLLRPGVLSTWNGAAFDLPFLADRAALHGIELGLELQHDPAAPVDHQPLPGHRGAYRARWYDHRHVDAYRLHREVGPGLRIPAALRAIARLAGVPTSAPVAPITELAHEARHALPASDARLARVLVQRRWSAAARTVDRITATSATTATTSTASTRPRPPEARHGRHLRTDGRWDDRPGREARGAVA